MSIPSGRALEMEQSAFADVGLAPEDFRKSGRDKVKGARRPLRVKPTDIRLEGGVDEHGARVTVAFSLAAGSYATVFLSELMKSDQDEIESSQNEDSGSAEPSPEVDGEDNTTGVDNADAGTGDASENQ